MLTTVQNVAVQTFFFFLTTHVQVTSSTPNFTELYPFLQNLRADSVVSASQVRQNFIHLPHRYKTDKALIVQIDKGMPNGAADHYLTDQLQCKDF